MSENHSSVLILSRNQRVSRQKLRTEMRNTTEEEQLKRLDKRERHCSEKYQDPGFRTPDDYTRAIMWISGQVWRPLKPVDMPYTSWWTLFKIARDDPAAFYRQYVKSLISNPTAQKTVKERPKVEHVSDEGAKKLEGLLNGSSRSEHGSLD